MNTLQNLHQHSTFCDGHDTPEEVVLTAIEKGFGGIGFSSHCYMPYAAYYSMSLESTKEYRQEIARLKEKYGHQIDVFCGIEFDICCPERPEGYDYVIGSLHGLRFDGEDYEFDGCLEHFLKMINEHCGCDGMFFAKEYYRQLPWLAEAADCDIIGHFDLITKHRDTADLFDSDSKEYRFAAIEAAEALAGKIPYFEVNTGGVARGYRTTPYPDPFLLKELKRLGFGAVISSDCHRRAQMDFFFPEAKELLRSCGFEEHYILTKQGFVPVPLDA